MRTLKPITIAMFVLFFTLALASLPADFEHCSPIKYIEAPEYPELARQAAIEGAVNVQLVVGPNGRVISARAITGNPILKQEAERNAANWVFADGKEQHFEIHYDFRLENPRVSYVPRTKVSFYLPGTVKIVSHAPIPIKDSMVTRPRN
jgi:TonB family protein